MGSFTSTMYSKQFKQMNKLTNFPPKLRPTAEESDVHPAPPLSLTTRLEPKLPPRRTDKGQGKHIHRYPGRVLFADCTPRLWRQRQRAIQTRQLIRTFWTSLWRKYLSFHSLEESPRETGWLKCQVPKFEQPGVSVTPERLHKMTCLSFSQSF